MAAQVLCLSSTAFAVGHRGKGPPGPVPGVWTPRPSGWRWSDAAKRPVRLQQQRPGEHARSRRQAGLEGPGMKTHLTAEREDVLEVIDEHQCLEYLHSSSLGRVAFTIGDELDIFPVNYACDGSI